MKTLAIFILGSIALIVVASAVPSKTDKPKPETVVRESELGDYPTLKSNTRVATKSVQTLPLMVQGDGEEMIEENCRQMKLLKQEAEQLHLQTLKLKELIQRTK